MRCASSSRGFSDKLFVLASCVILLGASSSRAQEITPVTVYVFTKTDPSGYSDPFQKQRLESLEHLRTALAKKKRMAVVDTAEGADLTVEVLAAGWRETGAELTQGGVGVLGGFYATTRKQTRPQVHVMLRSGTYQFEINGTSGEMKRAAGAAADGVETWVKQNGARLGTGK